MLVVHCDGIDAVVESATEALLISGTPDQDGAFLEIPGFAACVELRPDHARAPRTPPPRWEPAGPLLAGDIGAHPLVVHIGETFGETAGEAFREKAPHKEHTALLTLHDTPYGVEATAFTAGASTPDQLRGILAALHRVITDLRPRAPRFSLSLLAALIRIPHREAGATASRSKG